MKKSRLSQRKKEWLFVLALFLASTAFYFLIGDFPRKIRIYWDEMRYFMLSENIATGRGLVLHNMPTDYQKVLYSLFLAPLFLVGDRWLRMHLLALANAAVMSMGVVPVYLLARDLIRDRKRVAAACLLYVLSVDMVFSLSLMSEVLFLPLGLWGVWGFYRLIVFQGGAGKRRLMSAALGVYVYVLYVCKEIAPAFLIAYGVYAAVRSVYPATFGEGYSDENRAEIRTAWGNLALMLVTFFAAFLAMKRTVFRGLGGSYHQSSLDVLLLPGRARFMLYGFAHYLCSVVIAAGFFPLVLPLAFPNRLGDRAKKLLLFLLSLLVISAAVVAYTITVREDFGLIPRPIFRYICYLFPVFIIVFLHQTEQREAVGRRSLWRTLLGGGLLIFMLCWFWQGQRDVSTNDHLMLKYLTGTPQDNLTLILLLWGVILLLGTALFSRRPGLTLCVYLMAFGTVQTWNSAYVIKLYRDLNRISDAGYTDVNELSKLLDAYGEGNILFIPGNRPTIEAFDTYLNRPNLYTILNIKELLEMQGEDGIDLSAQHIPNTPEGMKDVRLVILPTTYAFEEDGPELIRANKRANIMNDLICNVYDLHDATVLPRIRLWWDIRDGENVFDVTPEHFSSNFDPAGNRFTSYVGQDHLLFGPYRTLPAGDYDITFEYRYEGDVPSGERIGYVDLRSENADLSAYEETFLSGETSVTISGVHLEENAEFFETRMWVDVPGVTAERVIVVKK